MARPVAEGRRGRISLTSSGAYKLTWEAFRPGRAVCRAEEFREIADYLESKPWYLAMTLHYPRLSCGNLTMPKRKEINRRIAAPRLASYFAPNRQ